jgi:hypothetical protein
MRPTKIRKTKSEPWNISDKINSILAFLTFVAVVGTLWSTKIARDALDLQRTQAVISEKKDSLNSIQDSIKNDKFIKLAEQQILALKEQTGAVDRGVRNTEIAERPYFVVKDFGFHKLGKEDKYQWSLKIQNYGERPAFTKETKIYFLNDKFQLTGQTSVEITTLTYKDFVVIHEISPILNGKQMNSITKKEILSVEGHYIAFGISYYDPLLKKNIALHDRIQSFKWIKKDELDLFYRKVGDDLYLYYDSCSDFEDSKILEAIKNTKG